MPRLIARSEITAKKPLVEIPAEHAVSWGPRAARHLLSGGAIDAGDRYHVIAEIEFALEPAAVSERPA